MDGHDGQVRNLSHEKAGWKPTPHKTAEQWGQDDEECHSPHCSAHIVLPTSKPQSGRLRFRRQSNG